MYFLYTCALFAAFLLAVPWYVWRGRLRGDYPATIRERRGHLPPSLNPERRPSIWIHAVSMGEALAAEALVAPLRERLPGRPLLLSTTTMTGRSVADHRVKGLDGVMFAPYDFPGPVARVVDRVNPQLLLLVETELWPNLIHRARGHGARVAVVNGRISTRAFSRYRLARPFLRHVLAEVDLFLMQEELYAERIREMGAPPERVRVVGSLKFDALRPAEPSAALKALAGEGPLWVAGSTVEGEEAAVLAAWRSLRARVPDLRLLIAPRHPERFDPVAALIASSGARCLRRSQSPAAWGPDEVMLLDTLGELAQVYPLATVVFIGGTLTPHGGHNFLEAAQSGRAVVVGPDLENFRDAAARFLAKGALVQVAAAAELLPATERLLTDGAARAQVGDAARELVETSRGTLATTIDAVAALLEPGARTVAAGALVAAALR